MSSIVLVVKTTDGILSVFNLEKDPVSKFVDDRLVITSSDGVVDFPLENVDSVYYDYSISSVGKIHKDEGFFKVIDRKLYFSSGDKEGNLEIYTLSGQTIYSKHINKSNMVVSPLDNISNGIYIVKFNEYSEKIIIE